MLTVEQFDKIVSAYLATRDDEYQEEKYFSDKEYARCELDNFREFLFPDLYQRGTVTIPLDPSTFESEFLKMLIGPRAFDLDQLCRSACNRIGLELNESVDRAHSKVRGIFAEAHLESSSRFFNV